MSSQHHCLTVSCPDATGIVAAVASFFAARRINIVEAAYFADQDSGRFFMRTVFDGTTEWTPALGDAFAATVAQHYSMDWHFYDARRKSRLLILVSRFDHCLNDLLYRYRTGSLPVEIPAIVSNHPVLEPLARWHGVPFHHLPVSAATRAEQEAAILDMAERERVDRSSSPATCRSCRPPWHSVSPAGQSTSTIRSCPASRAPSRTSRRMHAA